MLRYLCKISLILWFLAISPDGDCQANTVCFSASCHNQADFKDKVVHAPLNKGQCSACHNPHVAHYEGLLDKSGTELCFSCHEKEEKTFYEGVVHKPIREGKCLSCHAPHVSSRQGLLKDRLSATCFGCHEKLPEKYPHTHSPYAKGQCTACHRPHQSEYGQLLVGEGDVMCLACHKAADLRQGHPNYPGGQPSDCLSCHSPHGSDRKGLIRNMLHEPFAKGCQECHKGGEPVDTDSCLKCHEKVATGRNMLHTHLGGKADNTCVACHSPHAADDKNLLKGSHLQVCRSCHEETLGRYEKNLYRHPLASKCIECHDVHGSNQLAMLRADGNEVCTRCHETQGQFTHPVGEKVIDIRSGQVVTCLTCHIPMGSDFKYHLTFSGSKDLCVQCHKSY